MAALRARIAGKRAMQAREPDLEDSPSTRQRTQQLAVQIALFNGEPEEAGATAPGQEEQARRRRAEEQLQDEERGEVGEEPQRGQAAAGGAARQGGRGTSRAREPTQTPAAARRKKPSRLQEESRRGGRAARRRAHHRSHPQEMRRHRFRAFRVSRGLGWQSNGEFPVT